MAACLVDLSAASIEVRMLESRRGSGHRDEAGAVGVKGRRGSQGTLVDRDADMRIASGLFPT
jgi:hypothetical protein